MQKADYENADAPREKTNHNSINVCMHAGGNMDNFIFTYLSFICNMPTVSMSVYFYKKNISNNI